MQKIGGNLAPRGARRNRLRGVPRLQVWIKCYAFRGCGKLSAVELAGIIRVESCAFPGCNSLEHIRIPSQALVFQRENDRIERYARPRSPLEPGTIARTSDVFVLIAFGCLTTLPESNLTDLGNSIDSIVHGGEGTEEDLLGEDLLLLSPIRQDVRKEVRVKVSAILGLVVWKAKMDEDERVDIDAANDHSESEGRGRKKAKVGIVLTREAREGCRDASKGKVIAENVLPFLDSIWDMRRYRRFLGPS